METLLHVVNSLINRVYAFDGPDPAAFIIGDGGRRLLYRGATVSLSVGAATGGAQVLLRPAADATELRVSIYFPDELIRQLETNDPARQLHDDNIDAFLGFIEEIDHFQLVAFKWRRQAEFSLFELELHANLTKLFLARHFLRRQGHLDDRTESWLAYHLFHKHESKGHDDAVTSRYHDARRFGLRFARHLMSVPAVRRLRELRSWTELSPQGKIAYIEKTPAPSFERW